jgi:hypothetical protein
MTIYSDASLAWHDDDLVGRAGTISVDGSGLLDIWEQLREARLARLAQAGDRFPIAMDVA